MTAALVAVSILVGQTPAQPAPAFDVPMPLGLQAPAAAAPLEPPSAPSQAALQSVEVGVDKVDQLPSVLKRSHAPVARPQAVAVQAAASQPRAPTATKSDSAAQSMVARRYPPFADRENAQGLLHLREVVGGSTDTAQRRAAIKLYWEAASLLADWKFARERLQRLSELPPPGDAAAQQDYEAALAAARARLVEAEMAATTARYTLAEVTSGPAGQLPIPADRPFVGPYRTLFDTLFANRPAPPALRRIHATLPLRRQLVDARAAAVAAAAEALEGQMEAYQAG